MTDQTSTSNASPKRKHWQKTITIERFGWMVNGGTVNNQLVVRLWPREPYHPNAKLTSCPTLIEQWFNGNALYAAVEFAETISKTYGGIILPPCSCVVAGHLFPDGGSDAERFCARRR